MSTEVKAFVCDFCPRKKRFAARGTAERHERRCFYNPVRRACASCAHFKLEPYYYESDTGYSDGGPSCAVDALNRDPKALTVLRSECQLWEPKPA